MSEEADIQRLGIAFAKNHPTVAKIYRSQSGKVKVKGGWMQLCPEGTPDATGYTVDGRIIGIEFKTPSAFKTKNHGASLEQVEHLSSILKAGGIAGIATCNEDVAKILSGIPHGLID